MSARVPVQHYNLRSASSFIGSPLHDLNTVDATHPDIEPIRDVDRDAVPEDSLNDDDDDQDSNHVVSVSSCMRESFRNALPIHGVGVDEDSASLDNSGSSRGSYAVLTIDDVSPIESARARFLQIVVDHFINDHVIEADEADIGYTSQTGQDTLNKRKIRDYEGDPNFVLPLMYVANMYETLVNDVNMRLASMNGIRDKTIGVALEAAGGLYRRLAQKFPKKGPYTFKRRELATSIETRTRFPELVIQEEKRVRFVVINGLDIVEKPQGVPTDDAQWFKRLTGRSEVALSSGDYKFYSPRHKFRRVGTNSISHMTSLPAFSSTDNSSAIISTHGFSAISEMRLVQGSFLVHNPDIGESQPQNQQQASCKHQIQPLQHQSQFHSVIQNQHHSQQTANYAHNHQCGPPSHLPDISPNHHQPTLSQHMTCLPQLSGGHVGGRLHVLPCSPAKFCDECGGLFVKETSKFCTVCGAKRLGT